jgi:hypothetical protein
MGPDGRVYVRMGAQRIAALSPSTGAVLNTFNHPNNLNADWANPDVGSDGSVYVAASFGSTFGLTATLTQKWSGAGNSVSVDFAGPRPGGCGPRAAGRSGGARNRRNRICLNS